MSRVIDQIKLNLRSQFSKIYRDLKGKTPDEDWNEFLSWFWKIRPHLEVDFSQYTNTPKSETSGPNLGKSKEIVPVDTEPDKNISSENIS